MHGRRLESLAEIATRDVLTLSPDHTLGEAARIMAERRISSIIVVDDMGRALGIVTERNVLRALTRQESKDTTLGKVMSSPLVSVPEEMASQDGYLLCLRKGIRHLVTVNNKGELRGIVSETDFRLHMNLTALAGRQRVSSVMTQTMLSLPPDASFLQALKLMENSGKSAAVVTEDKRPVGIVSERDLVRLFAHGVRPEASSLAEIMVFPVLSVPVDTTINETARLMLEAKVRQLVVVDPNGELAGIISEHDLTNTMASGVMDAEFEMERAFLHGLIDTIPDLVWLKDPNGVYLACNRRFEKYLGALERDIVGKTDYDFIDRKLAALFQENDLAAITNGGPTKSEERVAFAEDGHEELVETIRTPMFGTDGKLIGVLGVSRDVTAARRNSDALQESEERLRTLIDAIPDSVQFKDSKGHWLASNHQARMTFGLERIDWLGKSDEELAHEVKPKYRPILSTFRDSDLATFQSGAIRRSDEKIRHDNGDVLYFNVTKVPLFHSNGDPKGLVVLARDITEHKKAEADLKLAASVFTNTQEGIVITDASGRIVNVNDAFIFMTGYERDEVVGKNPSLLKSGRHGREFYESMWQVLNESGHWRGEVWNRRKDGHVYAEYLTISAVRDEEGEVSHYVGVFSDITKLKEHEYQLERFAHYDALTGVPNRRMLAGRMTQAITQARRANRTLAVCYLDLDGFKPLNDTFGHAVGDHILVETTTRIKKCLRSGDTIARVGGDEFVILLFGLNHTAEFEAALDRILSAIAEPIFIGGQMASLSASVGVSLLRNEEIDADTLLHQADQAMYQAKEAGRNRYHFYSSTATSPEPSISDRRG